MKIACIGSRGFPGFNAGVEKSLEEICPRLAGRGHDVTVYCSDRVATSEPLYKKTVLKRFPAFPSKHLETISRVALAGWDAVFEDFDIVHFHSIGPALLSWIARFGKNKTVVTVHGLDWQRAKWGLVARTSLQIGEFSSVLFPNQTIVVSQHLKRYFKERYGREVEFIPNGVNRVEPVAPKLIRSMWGLNGKDYILFASRLVPEKECHTLINAFREIKTDYKLVIAGASWHSDDYVAELKKMAGGHPGIIFAGWTEGALMEELYSNALAFCLPSKIEGLSLALLEAMGYGACILVSDIPENTDVAGEHCLKFPAGDHEALRACLEQVISDPANALRLGGEACDKVRREYSWDKNVNELEQAYFKVLSD